MARINECGHPNAPYYARSMCNPCYQREYRQRPEVRERKNELAREQRPECRERRNELARIRYHQKRGMES
jgi:hypothetical protein